MPQPSECSKPHASPPLGYVGCMAYAGYTEGLPLGVTSGDMVRREEIFAQAQHGHVEVEGRACVAGFVDVLDVGCPLPEWRKLANIAGEVLHGMLCNNGRYSAHEAFIAIEDVRTFLLVLRRAAVIYVECGAASPTDLLFLSFTDFQELFHSVLAQWGIGQQDAWQAFRDAGAEDAPEASLLPLPRAAVHAILLTTPYLTPNGLRPPQRYTVSAPSCIIRSSVELSSSQVGAQLPHGTELAVSDIIGRRAFITAPLCGWVSLHTTRGESILEAVSAERGLSSLPVSEERHQQGEEQRDVRGVVSPREMEIDLNTIKEAPYDTKTGHIRSRRGSRGRDRSLSANRIKTSPSLAPSTPRGYSKPTQSACIRIRDPENGQPDFAKYPWDYTGYVPPLKDASERGRQTLRYALGKEVSRCGAGSASFKSHTKRDLSQMYKRREDPLGPGAYHPHTTEPKPRRQTVQEREKKEDAPADIPTPTPTPHLPKQRGFMKPLRRDAKQRPTSVPLASPRAGTSTSSWAKSATKRDVFTPRGGGGGGGGGADKGEEREVGESGGDTNPGTRMKGNTSDIARKAAERRASSAQARRPAFGNSSRRVLPQRKGCGPDVLSYQVM